MKQSTFIIEILSGFGRGKKTQVTSDHVSFGTAGDNDVQFDPEWDRGVDPVHARLLMQGNGVVIEDKSRGGCLLDGRRLRSGAEVPSGAELVFGSGGPKVRVQYEIQPQIGAVANSPVPSIDASPRSETEPIEFSEIPAQPPGVGKKPDSMMWVAAAGVLVLLVAGVLVWALRGPKNDEPMEMADKVKTVDTIETAQEPVIPAVVNEDNDTKFARMVREYEQAVAVVVIGGSADSGPVPMATAWAIAPHTYATNSHVTEPVKQLLDQGERVYLAVNQSGGKRLRVVDAVVHRRYGEDERNFDGKSPAIPIYDVGILVTREQAPKVLPVASREELERMGSGYAVCFVGFPMEGMSGGGVDPRNPVATMQSGIITSNTDYWLSKADFPDRKLVSHNMGATGGASGSPIINTEGRVVAILSAGNIIGQVVRTNDGGIFVQRAPSAAMINFGQRVDLLRDVYEGYPTE